MCWPCRAKQHSGLLQGVTPPSPHVQVYVVYVILTAFCLACMAWSLLSLARVCKRDCATGGFDHPSIMQRLNHTIQPKVQLSVERHQERLCNPVWDGFQEELW